MVNDLHAVPIRISEIAGPRPVAMRARRRGDRHAVAFEKRRPGIDILCASNDNTEMIER